MYKNLRKNILLLPVCFRRPLSRILFSPVIPSLALVVLFVAIFASPLFSLDPGKQVTQYVHDDWGLGDGLPQVSVQTIIRDRRGYLWLGTQEGLVRFDGVRFRVFDKTTVDQMSNNNVYVLYQDRRGNLWIGTLGGGLLQRSPADGSFTRFSTKNGLSSDIVYSIGENSEGNLLVVTENGLNCLHPVTGKIIDSGLPDELKKPGTTSIYLDSRNVLWIGTKQMGLYRLENGTVTNVYAREQGLTSNYIFSVKEGRQGRLWILTPRGLNCLENDVITSYTTKEGLTRNNVRCVHEDAGGNVWIGTWGGGLNRLTNGKITVIDKETGLTGNYIWSLYEDPEGSLWIGTLSGGMNRLKNGTVTTYSNTEGLMGDAVLPICRDNQGRMWIGTSAGLNCLTEETGAISSYTEKEGLSQNNVSALHADRAGTLWVGTLGGGLNRFQNNKFSVFTKKDGVSGDHISSLYEDRAGTLWIGTYDGGLSCLKDGVFSSFTTGEGESRYPVYTLHEDRAGNLWIGKEDGLARLDKDTGKVVKFETEDPISSITVFSFYEDSDGVLWIGTTGGLKRFQNGIISTVTVKEGLFDDSVLCIFDDPNNFLWMSCPKGIFRVEKQQLTKFFNDELLRVSCISYNERDGMKSRECNGGIQPAGWKNPDGKLWFATMKGAAMIDPGNLEENRVSPPVVIESLEVDNVKIEVFPHGERLLFEPGKGNVEIQYTGLSYVVPDNVCFKYRLVGLEDEWKKAGTRRTAYYTNLYPGYYTFKVIACNNNCIWNETGASVSFYIEPHFYQTTWFIISCVLLVSFVAFSFYRLRIRALKRRARELAEARDVAEKAKQTAEKADRAKSLFIANMSHEIRTPLNAVMGFTEILGNEITNPKHKEYLDAVSSGSKTLLALINDILDLSRLESGKFRLQCEPVNPRSLLGDIESIFAARIKEKGLVYRMEIDPALPENLILDQLRMRQVLFNLVGNAVKFTHQGSITVSVSIPPGSIPAATTDSTGEAAEPPETVDLVLSVTDTGIGIPRDQHEVIFETFSQADGQPTARYGGAGLGLSITKRLTHMMGGDITVESDGKTGSTFRVTLKNIVVSSEYKDPHLISGADAAAALSRGETEGETDSSSTAEDIRFHRATILVVDDFQLNRWLLMKLLEFHDQSGEPAFDLIEARDGEETLDLAEKYNPQLILLDMKMPLIDGYEIARILKGHNEMKKIPIVAVSASPREEEISEMNDVGCDDILERPLDRRKLIQLLKKFLPHTVIDQSEKAEAIQDDTSPEIIISPADIARLTEHMETDLFKRWQRIKKTMMLDEVEDFSVEIMKLGNQSGMKELEQWGDKLNKEIKSFDMRGVAQTMAGFPQLIDEIKKQEE